MKIFKFGGASIKDAEGVKNVADIIQSQMQQPLLIVVSAMGKSTNHLEKLADAFFYRKTEKETIFQDIKNEHFAIVNNLFDGNTAVCADIENLFASLHGYIQEEASENYDFEYDQIVSYGELAATKIVSHYLQTRGLSACWIDARTLVRTDNTYREGAVDWEKTQRKIKKNIEPIYNNDNKTLAVTQGFIGGTSEGLTTTLGREGSDFSGAIFGFSLDAESVTIWKDVEGLLNADPRLFADTIKLNKISYREAIELAYYGASIIHPKTLKPLQNKNIPLYVKSFLNPKGEGSVIGDFAIKRLIPCYICKKNQVLISISPKDFSFIAEENLSTIFGLFAFFGVKINLTQNSALSFSLCVDYKSNIQHLIDRGFTGHQHLDAFALINMGGRMYDPIVQQFLSPDPYVQMSDNTQNLNRYAYCLNSPLMYTDPTGKFFVADSWIVGFIHGFFSKGSDRFKNGWKEANKTAGNDAKIWGGAFTSDKDKNGWGQFWEVISRFTWQSPQTLGGFLTSHAFNTFGLNGRVESVKYKYGATVVRTNNSGWGAVTQNSFIIGGKDDLEADMNNGYFQHEYGHYLQSQKMGFAYYSRVGIPSLLSDNRFGAGHNMHPVEQDANARAIKYFYEKTDGKDFVWDFIENPIGGFEWTMADYNTDNFQRLLNSLHIKTDASDYLFWVLNGFCNAPNYNQELWYYYLPAEKTTYEPRTRR